MHPTILIMTMKDSYYYLQKLLDLPQEAISPLLSSTLKKNWSSCNSEYKNS